MYKNEEIQNLILALGLGVKVIIVLLFYVSFLRKYNWWRIELLEKTDEVWYGSLALFWILLISGRRF